jgi:hypothetical protein
LVLYALRSTYARCTLRQEQDEQEQREENPAARVRIVSVVHDRFKHTLVWFGVASEAGYWLVNG